MKRQSRISQHCLVSIASSRVQSHRLSPKKNDIEGKFHEFAICETLYPNKSTLQDLSSQKQTVSCRHQRPQPYSSMHAFRVMSKLY